MNTVHVDPFANLDVDHAESRVSEDEEDEGLLTPSLLESKCKEHHGYRSPELNEKLYLHHCKIRKLCPLDAYTNVRVLYLSGNSIQDLKPLAPLVSLVSLYTSQNGLESLDSLPLLPQLTLLDVSYNQLECLDVGEKLPKLENLTAAHNSLRELTATKLEAFPHLQVLDISFNKVDEEGTVWEELGKLTGLRTLMLHGNAAVRSLQHYRKHVIALLPELRFLDEYPVFEEERQLAEAFASGGTDLENTVRQQQQEAKAAARERQFSFFEETIKNVTRREEKKEPSQYLLDQTDDIYIPNA
ncbi:hypothetical protein AGDE_10094 [Angomonas deanei]|nr:hypothetical protein AGDE_10094 [Angomonas deanei]|eukprot:EPY29163.1 hypothetical protein AGDE_10094 [Angomonas deanei]